ncbi:MAG TPA: ATP-binding protein, partial [Armatimonadota bacterium]
GIPTARAIGRRLPALGLPQFPANGTEEHFQELLLRTREGYEIPVSISVTPFFRHWDVAECHLVVIRDLSELRLLEQEKLGAERFSSMGAMAASLAHEIKNPLVPIQTFAHLLPQKYADEEFRREFIPTVLSEVQRIDTLVSKMVDLVHNPAVRWASVDLREIVRGVLRLVRPECDRQGIKLHLYFADDLPFINGVEEQLYQVLLNIFNNAVQAMPHGGEIAIAVHAVGSEVVCKVTDTGPGVPKEDLHKIFEPLFTTKLGGHGMGLALAFRFVRSHRGDIHAECAAEGGLSLTITLPVLEAVEDESSPTPAPVS